MKAYLICGLFLLSACTTREQIKHESASKAEAQKMDEELHVGMSFEDVQKISSKTSDCKGSKKSFMQCRVGFMTHAGRYFPLKQQVGTSDVYRFYLLYFERNKLTHWKTETESYVR
jgi:hypothetical protein